MPIGSIVCLSHVVSEVIKHQPRTIIDLGIGNGLNGAAIRNYLPDVNICGVEVWEGYRNPMWECYDKVYIKNIRLAFLLNKYDCIIMTDVLEHFEKDEGFKMLDLIKRYLKPNGIALVSTPGIFMEQGAVGGNEAERHLSFWKPEDFTGWEILKDGTIDHLGHLMILAKFTK